MDNVQWVLSFALVIGQRCLRVVWQLLLPLGILIIMLSGRCYSSCDISAEVGLDLMGSKVRNSFIEANADSQLKVERIDRFRSSSVRNKSLKIIRSFEKIILGISFIKRDFNHIQEDFSSVYVSDLNQTKFRKQYDVSSFDVSGIIGLELDLSEHLYGYIYKEVGISMARGVSYSQHVHANLLDPPIISKEEFVGKDCNILSSCAVGFKFELDKIFIRVGMKTRFLKNDSVSKPSKPNMERSNISSMTAELMTLNCGPELSIGFLGF